MGPMWQLQNKILEEWYDQWVYYSLLSYYSPIMMFSDYDEFYKTVCMNGVKSNNTGQPKENK